MATEVLVGNNISNCLKSILVDSSYYNNSSKTLTRTRLLYDDTLLSPVTNYDTRYENISGRDLYVKVSFNSQFATTTVKNSPYYSHDLVIMDVTTNKDIFRYKNSDEDRKTPHKELITDRLLFPAGHVITISGGVSVLIPYDNTSVVCVVLV